MTLARDLRRRRVALVVAVVALLVALTLQGTFVVRVLGLAHRNEQILNEREAKSKAAIAELQGTIDQLRAAQASTAGITECVRKLNAAYVLAEDTDRHLWDSFVADPALDREQAGKDLIAADKTRHNAALAVDAFAHTPFLPCPTP